MAARVLLIEDEPNIAEAIRFVLTRDGCDVLALSQGGGAVAMMVENPPDLVILDLMLPDVSGLDVLADLRGREQTRAIPVLMLTAKGQGRDREAAERAGASHFMTKPFSNDDMREAVRTLLAAGGGQS